MAEPLTTLIGLGIGAIILIVFLGLAILALAIFLFIFWILMIVDCATRKFKDDIEKVVWILLLIFLHLLGAIIYYFVVKRSNKR
jgi:hypothetical protein